MLVASCAIVIALPAVAAGPQRAGSVAGQVLTSEGEAAVGAKVTFVQLRREATTDEAGSFGFDRVPAGDYLLVISHPRFGSAVASVTVEREVETRVTVHLDPTVHREEVSVTAGVSPGGLAEMGQSVAVLDRELLTREIQPTLGETLAGTPGVSSTSYAPGSSRPVIRGLGGDRIRILEDGVGLSDASNVSPDHAVSFDPLAAERVEIVRGPAMLLYGTNAGAGVVNVLSGRVPSHVPERPIGGDVLLRAGTVDDDREGAFAVRGGAGRFGWHLDGNERRTDDVETPNFTVTNSEVDSEGGGAGVSWVGESGYAGVSYGLYDTLYGIAVEDDVRIDLEQRRFDLTAERTLPFGPFSSARLRAGRSDYKHAELESAEVGTVFESEGLELRLDVTHRPLASFEGRFGVQYAEDDFSAVGEEAFIAPAKTDGWAVFGFEELAVGQVRVQLGARFESQAHDSVDPVLRDRDFEGVAGSAGLVWLPSERWSVAGTVARSDRFPTAEELYSNGVHVATQSVELGDDDLEKETSLAIDVTLRRRTGRVTGELTLFTQRYDDFIYDRDTGTTLDTGNGRLPVFQYTQEDADFYGAELHFDLELLHNEPHHLQLELEGDGVRAELRDSDEPLPRIPPQRWALALDYQGSHWTARAEWQYVAEQTRVALNETSTDDYSLVGASVGYRFFLTRQVHELLLRGSNLTDEVALNHVSRFKDVVPLPGRDVSLIYRWIF